MDSGVDPSASEAEELTALRRRAYGPDADISRDPDAVARLMHLEELSRAARISVGDASGIASTSTPAPYGAASTGAPVEAPATPVFWTPKRTTLRGAFVGVTVVVTAVLGVTAWSTAESASLELLDSRRDVVLAGADLSLVAGRIIRDELRPLGDLYGRSVWAGPTVDGAVCLVVEGVEAPVIMCGSSESVAEEGLNIDVFAHIDVDEPGADVEDGQRVRITLTPDGAVLARPLTEQ